MKTTACPAASRSAFIIAPLYTLCMKTCECGCGEIPALAASSDAVRGRVRGEPVRFVKGHNRRKSGVEFVAKDRGYRTPCHIWQRAKIYSGYGQQFDPTAGKVRAAHVIAYERANGPIPLGMEPDHLCRQRDCVNADHMEAVTHAENTRRALELDRCRRGHEYTVRASGKECLTCARERNRRYQERTRATLAQREPRAPLR